MILALLTACTFDYGLDAVAEPELVPTVTSTTSTPRRIRPTPPVFSPVSSQDDDGGALLVEEDAERGIRRETFELGGGASTSVADFLFVVDDSASMQTVVDRVRAAFRDLGTGTVFPTDARIAVMSTLPADLTNLSVVHPAARHRGRNRLAPGFVRLVDNTGISRFLGVAPEAQKARFAEAGCASGWFTPAEANAAGTPCIIAHTQLSLDAVMVEAGLTSFGQLLERHGDEPLFRPGAAANVIFVSDTQDPGLGVDDPSLASLVAARPDFVALSELVDRANTVSSFRVHAIAPELQCGEGWAHLGDVYQQAARASGGETLDMCTASDYRGFIEAIAREGAVVQRPVLALGRPLADAIVEIDGERVGWAPSPDGRALTIDRALGDDVAKVTVTYKVREGGPLKKRR